MSIFASEDLHPKLREAIAEMGFDQPTPIQRDAIPPGLEGRDLLACAMTGSGKTAAFLIPTLQRLLATPRKGVSRVLVLTPTRELAAQIVEHCQALSRFTNLRAKAIYGGVAMGPQEKALRQGVEVLVACPGRLLDHFQYDYARLSGLEVLILDEADRMLDMGFLPDIRRVLRHLPQVDQTMLFSATMPAPIVELSKKLLDDPVRIDVERRSAPAPKIEQGVYRVRQDLKSRLLVELLDRGGLGNVLVFTRTKHRANRLAEFLDKHGVSSERIHGNRSQAQRTKALAGFKDGSIRVLVATDIAARGIDVRELSHVVNFDVPNLPEDYIHRVGRTARAEATGSAFTFVSPQERKELAQIERAVGARIPVRHLEGFDGNGPKGEALEIPIGQRIAEIRARKAEERKRAAEKKARKEQGARGRSEGKAKDSGEGGRRRRRRGGGGRSRSAEGGGNVAAGAAARPTRGAANRPAGKRPAGKRPVGKGTGGGGSTAAPWWARESAPQEDSGGESESKSRPRRRRRRRRAG
ncbi:MAG: DEAD/DEAH box helicase [Acidobacteriota bacterium]